MWRVLAVYFGCVCTCGWIFAVSKEASSATHRRRIRKQRVIAGLYVVAVSRYRVKEAERTWKHSLNFNTRQRNAFWKGDFFVTGASRTIETRNDCAFFFYASFPSRAFSSFSFVYFFFLLSAQRGNRGRVSGVGMPLFYFLFSFFFTCFSNARWKMPRRMRVGVEHPFLWFWQLLAFVSAMEIVLGVLCYYLRASFLYSARESLSYCWLCVHVCCVRLCLFVDKSDLHVTMSSCSEWAKINSPFCNNTFIFWVSKNWPSVCNHIFISAVYF